MNDYQEQLLEHYHNPRNFRNTSFVATHSARSANLSCGDEIEIWLKVNKDGVIEDVSFDGEGCSISIASTSLLLDSIKGKTISEVNSLKDDYALSLIGIPLTMSRIKCALLPLDALKKSIQD